MKPLKFELVNGYGVLVDESEIKSGDKLIWKGKIYSYRESFLGVDFSECSKIIFAEKELNLEGVPVFEWRNFELNKLSTNFAMGGSWQCPISFEVGYKSNPAKFTEEDLMKIISGIESLNKETNSAYEYEIGKIEIIQSLQKYPKYVVMEREEKTVEEIQKELGIYGHDEGLSEREFEEYKKSKSIYKYKLFTNSDGKSQGTVKELIWES
jgi:hypothetical protein